MATKPNFGSLLDTQGDEIERPKAMPEGSYLWRVTGVPRYDVSSKKKTEFAEFTLTCLQSGADVDEDALKAWASSKDGSVRKLNEAQMRVQYYLTEASLYRLKEFLEHCGIEVEGRSLREAIEDTPNCEVGAYIRHEASNDGESTFARIGKTFTAEAFSEQQEAA